jgi:hypothetical protein
MRQVAFSMASASYGLGKWVERRRGTKHSPATSVISKCAPHHIACLSAAVG